MQTIYVNGVVHTLTGRDCTAFSVEGDRILETGDDRTLLATRRAGDEVVDLRGLCVVPGFNDSHCHIMHVAAAGMELNLRGAKSVEEVIARGRAYIAERHFEPGQWIIGRGYDQNLFEVKKLLTREVADAITTEYPLLLERVCGHTGTINSRGIECMGYDANTHMDGGGPEIGPDGRPTGVVNENALYRVTASVPKATSVKQVADMFAFAMREANRFGVTSIQSDDLEGMHLSDLDGAMAMLRSDGRMTARLYEEILTPSYDALTEFLECGRRGGDAWYTLGNIKIILDGSLGARTAWMRKPYPGTSTCGIGVMGDEELFRIADAANAAGMQLAFHAIGDAAIDQCLRAVEHAQKQGPRGLRHRVVHAQLTDPGLLQRIHDAGMGVDAQPAFTASDWQVAERVLDAERLRGAYVWRDMIDMGIVVGGSSDGPVETIDPLWGMYCATTRKDADGLPEGGWMPGQKLTAEQALRMYTTSGAYLSFAEHEKGRIAPGMLADFAVLSEDLLAVPPEHIRDIKVLQTITGGRTVYRAE